MSGHGTPSRIEDIQEHEELKAAEQMPDRIKGFYLTEPFNNEIERIRKDDRDAFHKVLGVDKDVVEQMGKTHPHKEALDVIIDTRVTAELRKKVEDHKEHHKTGWRYVPFSGEWRKNRTQDYENIKRFAQTNP